MFDIAKLAKRLRREKGFTLVELMVVVVIIGILVAIAIPIYNTVTDNAEKRAIQTNLRTIDSAIMQATAAGLTEIEYVDLEGDYFEPITPVGEETYGLTDDDPPRAQVTITKKEGGLENDTYTLVDLLGGSEGGE